MIPDPLIDRQFANYHIERVLGRGGMAVVYYATDVLLRRPAAVKVIDARFRGVSAYAVRFLHEARAVAACRHENILQIYYAGEGSEPGLEGIFFFAMEYIDGRSLGELLEEESRTGKRLPYGEVLRYGQAVAAALDYAHTRGLIHRDVKPSNVLVSSDGRILLSDFGLALDTQQGSVGEVFGTARYTAPEQARRSSDAVPASDLYSLGVMLYEMLTGSVPFDDPSPTSVALQHLTLPPPAPRALNPDLSQEVEDVLLKALSKNPADRYPSGRALVAALEDALRAAPTTRLHAVTPLPVPTSQRGWRSRIPRRALPAAAGIAGVVLIGLVVTAFSSARNSPLRTEAGSVMATASATTEFTRTTAEIVRMPETVPALPTATVFPAAAVSTASATQAVVSVPTALPSETPALQPSLTWTPRYAGGRHMVLMWDARSFYMLQTTGYGERIDPLVFERLDIAGQPAERFSGKLWAEFHASTLRGWCMRLEIGGPEGQFLRPAACKDQYVATRWPQPGDPTLFWTPKEQSTVFRVLWGRDEIQRCAIDAGTCEVDLP